MNASGVDVPAGSTALDAVRAWNDDAASAVQAGSRTITDSRGLPIDGSVAMNAGSILRVIAVRARASADDEPALDAE